MLTATRWAAVSASGRNPNRTPSDTLWMTLSSGFQRIPHTTVATAIETIPGAEPERHSRRVKMRVAVAKTHAMEKNQAAARDANQRPSSVPCRSAPSRAATPISPRLASTTEARPVGVPAKATMPIRNRVTPLVLSTHSKELRVSAGAVSSRHHRWLVPTAARAKAIQAISPTLSPSARSSWRASTGVPRRTAASVSAVARSHVKRGYVAIAAVSTAIAATPAWAASTSVGANPATMRRAPAEAKRPPDG